MRVTGEGYQLYSEVRTQQISVGVERNLIIIPVKLMALDRSEYFLDKHRVTATWNLRRGLPIFWELTFGAALRWDGAQQQGDAAGAGVHRGLRVCGRHCG